mgnify:CR=1 FL=1
MNGLPVLYIGGGLAVAVCITVAAAVFGRFFFGGITEEAPYERLVRHMTTDASRESFVTANKRMWQAIESLAFVSGLLFMVYLAFLAIVIEKYGLSFWSVAFDAVITASLYSVVLSGFWPSTEGADSREP